MKRECVFAILVLAVGVASAQRPEGTPRPVVDPSAPKPSGPQRPVVDPGNAAKAPSDAIVLFDGKDNSHWRTQDGNPSKCTVVDGVMNCRTGAGTIASTDKFKDAQIHLEFNIPNMPDQHGQLKGNSGAILQGRYEIQVLDSYQNPTYADGSCGALYGQSAPQVNASRPPGEWQTYDIVFHAPSCAPDGTALAPGSLTLVHNGVLVQDHVPVQWRGGGGRGAAGGGGAPAAAAAPGRGCVDEGPLVLQEHGGFKNPPDTLLKFRNIWMRRLTQ